MPPYELLDLERYFYFNEKGKDGRESYRYPGSERSVSMITSRGCPFNCIFCSVHLGMGKKFRAHSAESVIGHIRFLKEKYRINHIHFEDDNISLDTVRFKEILNGIIVNNLDVTWDTPNGLRADYLNEELLKKCKASGCTYLRIGVESANRSVNKEIIRKDLDIDKIVEVSGACKKVGIDLEAFYIIGFPGEKIVQMKETISFSVKQEFNYGLYPYNIFTATPLIGTDLYKICRQKGYLSKDISPENLATATQGEGLITTEDFSPMDLKKLLKQFRLRHYIAMPAYFIKFMISHPQYMFLRFKNRLVIKEAFGHFFRFQTISFLETIFGFRYKNCVINKVGIE